MKEEAADYVDTSTWTQQAREEYVEYELRKALDSRNMKQLNAAIKVRERVGGQERRRGGKKERRREGERAA